MNIELYTSQSLRYFNDIGKYSLASALKYLPENSSIIVTTEDYEKFPKLNPRIKVVDLYAVNNGFKEFQDRWTGKTMAKVINFAKKGYTVLYALENSKAEVMIWLDADANLKKPITEDWINLILKKNLGAQMGVQHEGGEFTVESGYFMMNLRHQGRNDFAKFYRDYYDNDRCENMGRFYDSNVHGHALKDCERIGHNFTEMNLRKKGNTPLKGSMIDGYVGHLKGKAKVLFAEEYYRDQAGDLKELFQ